MANAATGHASEGDFDRVLVVDFGAQYAQLIARRIREAHVFSEIVPRDITADEVADRAPIGIVLSGGPASVYEVGAYGIDKGIFDLGIPVLGICYGHQILANGLGGTVERNNVAEYGRADLTATADAVLFAGLPLEQPVWMSHSDAVTAPPPGFVVTASTADSPVAAMEDTDRGIYGVQFHPEVAHTPRGQEILKRFLYEACRARPTWTHVGIIEQSVAAVRDEVGSDTVICGLSGGVDSSVAAALVHKAIGDQLVCVFVDHGLLRKGEAEQVDETFRRTFNMNLIHVKAEDRFLSALEGVTDPERKRKIIGETFIRVFEDVAAEVADAAYLVQGTLYPDV
ncbi:MAG: glutamine-hydrolyzing GMP synthase, partial [Actinomycetota bacterium]|nr:glutamine-hydrolyzing GMP synthase [Actinomycetota bacterium]